jgi:RNA polymerase sigma-70 factor (ECF subfamily)
MTDGELVRLSLAGQSSAYAELARRWAARVTALCHAKVARADVADDLAQETLLRGLRHLATLTDPEKFGAWLCGIALRACLDWLKSKQRRTVLFSELGMAYPPDVADDPDPAVDRADDRRQLLAAVEALPPTCREAVMLYYYQEVSYRELARQLGVSLATINARLTKARGLLRERLAPYHAFPVTG